MPARVRGRVCARHAGHGSSARGRFSHHCERSRRGRRGSFRWPARFIVGAEPDCDLVCDHGIDAPECSVIRRSAFGSGGNDHAHRPGNGVTARERELPARGPGPVSRPGHQFCDSGPRIMLFSIDLARAARKLANKATFRPPGRLLTGALACLRWPFGCSRHHCRGPETPAPVPDVSAGPARRAGFSEGPRRREPSRLAQRSRRFRPQISRRRTRKRIAVPNLANATQRCKRRLLDANSRATVVRGTRRRWHSRSAAPWSVAERRSAPLTWMRAFSDGSVATITIGTHRRAPRASFSSPQWLAAPETSHWRGMDSATARGSGPADGGRIEQHRPKTAIVVTGTELLEPLCKLRLVGNPKPGDNSSR